MACILEGLQMVASHKVISSSLNVPSTLPQPPPLTKSENVVQHSSNISIIGEIYNKEVLLGLMWNMCAYLIRS